MSPIAWPPMPLAQDLNDVSIVAARPGQYFIALGLRVYQQHILWDSIYIYTYIYIHIWM